MDPIEALTRSARDSDLEFLVAGGHAVIAHGHQRVTFDVDLIVRRSDTDAWKQLLLGLGYVARHEGPAFVQFEAEDDSSPPVDLMIVEEPTFLKLRDDALPVDRAWGSARVVSLPHLLALKCHAIKHGHPGRVVKDADDLIRLVLANRLDVTAPGIRSIISRHGTAELYDKLLRATRSE